MITDREDKLQSNGKQKFHLHLLVRKMTFELIDIFWQKHYGQMAIIKLQIK